MPLESFGEGGRSEASSVPFARKSGDLPWKLLQISAKDRNHALSVRKPRSLRLAAPRSLLQSGCRIPLLVDRELDEIWELVGSSLQTERRGSDEALSQISGS